MTESPAQLFPTDEPVAPGQLIGRADDVKEIATQLELGANVILAAPRRTGKTTVCDAALSRLARQELLYTVNLDLFTVADVDQFAETLIEQTMRNRPALRKALFAAKQSGKTLYESLSLSVGAKMTGGGELEGIDFSVLPTLRQDTVTHLDYALALPQRIAAADGKRLVLFIDEFQDLDRIGENHERNFGEVLKRKMRAAFQRSPDVSFLFAGSLEDMMRSLFGRSDEAFFNFGSFHELGPILPQEWRAGLRSRFSKLKLKIDPAALGLLIARGGEHPRTIMLLAQQSYIAARLAETDEVTLGLVELAYLQALRVEQPKHQALVERIQRLRSPAVNRLALRTVVAVARGVAPYAAKGTPTEVKRALDALRDAGFIERLGPGRQGWRVVDPLFAAYLARLDLPGLI